jgi:hypothetical protein
MHKSVLSSDQAVDDWEEFSIVCEQGMKIDVER